MAKRRLDCRPQCWGNSSSNDSTARTSDCRRDEWLAGTLKGGVANNPAATTRRYKHQCTSCAIRQSAGPRSIRLPVRRLVRHEFLVADSPAQQASAVASQGRGANCHRLSAGLYRNRDGEDQSLVLVDLANFTGFYRVTPPETGDRDAIVFNEGMRAAYGRIFQYLRMSDVEVLSLETAARQTSAGVTGLASESIGGIKMANEPSGSAKSGQPSGQQSPRQCLARRC